MRCRSCGATVDVDDAYCSSCGEPVEGAAEGFAAVYRRNVLYRWRTLRYTWPFLAVLMAEAVFLPRLWDAFTGLIGPAYAGYEGLQAFLFVALLIAVPAAINIAAYRWVLRPSAPDDGS